MNMLNSQIVKGTPRWGQRAQEVLDSRKLSAIVLMVGKGSLKQAASSKDDWRFALMAKVTEQTQQQGSFVIPIIAQLDLEEDYQVPFADSLAERMGLTTEEGLPHIYFIHGPSQQTIAYPEKLEDMQKVSPELIMAWATVQRFEFDIKGIQLFLERQEKTGEDQKEIAKQEYELFSGHLEEAQKKFE